MSEAGDETSTGHNKHEKFVRSFSEIEYDSEGEDYDVLSPIPETPADQIDGGDQTPVSFDKPDGAAEEEGKAIIPFKIIFNPAGAYSSSKRQFWIPGIDVTVEIVDFERQDLKILNPYLYKIWVKHGDHTWIIWRRYKHFRQLHDALVLFRTRYNMPLPRRAEAKEHKKTLKKQWKAHESVKFPLTPDSLIRDQDIPLRKERLEKYLQNLLRCKAYRNHPETVKFFEVSHLSFVARLGPKLKEGMVKKCSGGRRISIGCCGCLQKVHFAGRWQARWLVLKDTYLAYIRPEDGVLSDVLLMDKEFKVECGMKVTGAKHGLMISNLNRNLLVKCWTSRKAREWAEQIEIVKKVHASDFTRPNRFNSYAPVREDSYSQWFVDSASYFDAVADALDKAKEEIYITDWWLSPEIYLKRPILHGDYWRLDTILARKAEQGVKVFVLLYKEIEAALGIKSLYSKVQLMNKHKNNIKVLRHPDHIPGKGILMWAHHEKLVAVDQQIAFIGGIDLCYGRWDDPIHRLTDLGSITLNRQPSPAVSSRREESAVTDFTEVMDDLRSVDSPASLRPINQPVQAHITASHYKKATARPGTVPGGRASETLKSQDVSITVIPPSPGEIKSDDSLHSALPSDGDQSKHIRESSVENGETSLDNEKAVASSATEGVDHEGLHRQHVFVNVVLDSQDSTSDGDAQDMTDFGSDKRSNHGDGSEDSSDNSSSSSPHHVSHSSKQSPACATNDRTTSVDSTASTGSAKRHLWGDRAGLKLKIPLRRSEEEQEAETRVDIVRKEDASRQPASELHDVHNGRLRAGSNHSDTSKTSDSGLIPKDGDIELRVGPPASAPVCMTAHSDGRDTLDFGGAASVMSLLRRKRVQEENNNKGRNSDGNTSGSSQARRRWKMIFNVRKFESTVRHAQVDRIPASLLIPDVERKKSLYHRMEQKFKREHKDSFHLGHMETIPKPEDAETLVYRTHSEQDILECGLDKATKLWIGKDYVNFIHKDFVELHKPTEDFIDRHSTPRMPWHDIGAMVYGKAARDVSRHFILRWNFTKLEKYKTKTDYPLLLPKTYPKMIVPDSIKNITFKVETQILRSLCGWASGIGSVEKSIEEAYDYCIESAKNFIYIENQFFITQVQDLNTVSNCIGTALYRRILRAHRNNEDFKVYVMMPLLPAFEGEFGTNSGTALQAITHWNYASICRGGNSIIEKLAASDVRDPHKYIVFCGLRKWEKLEGKLVSELIYIHSKLMIVDDNTVILGSANINDRSLLGKRDSELAVIIRDKERQKIHINGHILEPGPFASSMRQALFREHMGLPQTNADVDLMDISTDHFYKEIWYRQAAVNTLNFDKVFQCLPTDNVRSFEELRMYSTADKLALTNPAEAMTHLAKIKGHLVLMPLMFLADESLTPKMGQKEALLPVTLWT